MARRKARRRFADNVARPPPRARLRPPAAAPPPFRPTSPWNLSQRLLQFQIATDNYEPSRAASALQNLPVQHYDSAPMESMEVSFVPSTRHQNLLNAQDADAEHTGTARNYCYRELELTAQGAETFRNGTWNWEDLYDFFHGKNALWLGPDVFLGSGEISFEDDFVEVPGFEFVGWIGDDSWSVLRLYRSSNENAGTAENDILVNALLNCENEVYLASVDNVSSQRMFGQMLPQFLRETQRYTRLVIKGFELDEESCRQLDVEVREGFQLVLNCCTATEGGTRVICDVMRRNRGPSSLANCCIDDIALADALRGNTSVKELQLWGDRDESNNPAILRALGDNVGLTRLILRLECRLEVWTEMCHSLGGHPNIKSLNVSYTASHDESSTPLAGGWYLIMSGARKTQRTQALVDMMHVNTVIETILFTPDEVDEPLFENQVAPRLVINHYIPRFRAVTATRGALRAPLLGRAVRAVNKNTSLVYKLLSDNLDAISNAGGL